MIAPSTDLLRPPGRQEAISRFPSPYRLSTLSMSNQAVFGEGVSKHLEALYRIGDVVRRRALVRSCLTAVPGERILDAGCGPGFFCAELQEEVGPAGSVVGVDSSPAMLALAARRCEGRENVKLHQADVTPIATAWPTSRRSGASSLAAGA